MIGPCCHLENGIEVGDAGARKLDESKHAKDPDHGEQDYRQKNPRGQSAAIITPSKFSPVIYVITFALMEISTFTHWLCEVVFKNLSRITYSCYLDSSKQSILYSLY